MLSVLLEERNYSKEKYPDRGRRYMHPARIQILKCNSNVIKNVKHLKNGELNSFRPDSAIENLKPPTTKTHC